MGPDNEIKIPNFSKVELPPDVPNERFVLEKENLRSLPECIPQGAIWLSIGFPTEDLSSEENMSGITVKAVSQEKLTSVTADFLIELSLRLKSIGEPIQIISAPRPKLWILGIRTDKTQALTIFAKLFGELFGENQQVINIKLGENVFDPSDGLVSANSLKTYLLSLIDANNNTLQ